MKKTILIVALIVSSLTYAQKITVLSGNFINLKSISEYNLLFDYSDLKVDRVSEADFLADRMKKREGNGNDIKFKQNWLADRENRYEPKFIKSFNSRFKNGSMKANKNVPSSNYTMVVKTSWIHPGFNVWIMHNGSLINTNVTVYETKNPSNVLLNATFEKVGGKGAFAGPLGFLDYNTGYRISESYAKLAKKLASEIKRAK